MFVALELAQQEQGGILRRLRHLLAGQRVSLTERSLSGARYHVIRAPCTRGEPDWREIADTAGPMAGRMLLPDDVRPPEGSGILRLESPVFARKVLLATACALVARSRMPMYKRVLGLIDPDADFTDMLPGLLHHYTAIRVLTNAQERYFEAAERMMELLGAPVQVCGASADLRDCVLLLAPGEAMGGPFSAPVLAGDSYEAHPGRKLITDLRIAPAAPILDACPDGISPHRFAAALHDHCALEAGSYVATEMRCNYRVASLAEVALQLAQRADNSTKSVW